MLNIIQKAKQLLDKGIAETKSENKLGSEEIWKKIFKEFADIDLLDVVNLADFDFTGLYFNPNSLVVEPVILIFFCKYILAEQGNVKVAMLVMMLLNKTYEEFIEEFEETEHMLYGYSDSSDSDST